MIRKLTVTLLSGVICLLLGMSLAFAQGPEVYSTLNDYEASTGKKIEKFGESPMLRVKVAAGELPPIEERLPQEPLVIDPLEEIGQYGGQMVGYGTDARGWGTLLSIFQTDGLLRQSPSGSGLVPNLATNYEFSEGGKSLTIYLRKGVKWSDGVPFTADDILFAYDDIIMNEKLALQTGMSMQRQYYSPTEEPATIEKIDDYTVRFHFPEPYPIMELQLVMECGVQGKILFPKHYLEKLHIKYNPEANELAKEKGLEHWYELWPTMADVQTGPHNTTIDYPTLRAYVLREKGPGYMIAERNPYYWKVDTEGNQLPYIDKLMVVQNLDPEVATAKTLAGDFDYAGGSVEDLVLLKDKEAEGNYRVLIWKNAIASVFGFHFNQTYNKDLVLREIFRDVRFRRALSLAINREEINQVIYHGLVLPCQATVSPEETRYYEEEFGRAYAEHDPQKANAFLDEMGLDKRDKEGYRLREDGNRLSILIEYADWFSESLFELVKEYWEAVGVEVTLKPESAQLIFERYPANEVQIGGWQADRGTVEASLLQYPNWFVPCGWPAYNTQWPLWLLWAQTGGKEGEEPVEEVKKNLERLSHMQTSMDKEETTRLAKEILRSQAESLWVVGTVGFPPFIRVVRENLRNIPKEATMAIGAVLNPEAYLYPETFFFEKD